MARSNGTARTALLWATAFLGLVAAGTKRVKAGGSIQAVIDSASAGDQIIVEKGTYTEQLTITKDGIDLEAQDGVILLAPATYTTNGCTGLAGDGTQAGICIIGGNVKLGTFTTEHRPFISAGSLVKDVTVKGFDIRGFTGLNIAIVAAKNAEVRENTVSDGSAYGILTVGSNSTLITRNTVKTAAPLTFNIAICMDDQSDVSVTQNVVSDYFIGLCVQTNGADVGHNKVSNVCWGAFVDPGVTGARLTHNHFGATNPYCGNFAAGIILSGAINSDVQHNDVTGISAYGYANATAPGILITDDEGGAVASGNKVDFNDLSHNDVDISITATGKNNEVLHNTCSTPASVCTKQ